MKHPDHLPMRSLLLACCLAAAYPAAHAEETSTTTTTTAATSTSTTTTAVGTSVNTEAKLTAEFAGFLGGEAQAQSVVTGLRQGTAFDLVTETTTTDSAGKVTTTSTITTIDPPTDTMGYGNVRITLRLAEAQLSQMGITDPTAAELSAVLLGGDLNGTQVDGILTLRADGMGWGQIAKEYGMTVGQLMGKGAVKPTPTATTASQAKTTGKAGAVSSSTPQSGQGSQARSNGYIPGSSKSASATQARANGYIPSGSGKSSGTIVTAAGGSMGGSAQGVGKGQANKITSSTQGAGAVSAGGQQVSMSGVSNAGGSSATAPGQAKKN